MRVGVDWGIFRETLEHLFSIYSHQYSILLNDSKVNDFDVLFPRSCLCPQCWGRRLAGRRLECKRLIRGSRVKWMLDGRRRMRQNLVQLRLDRWRLMRINLV